MLLAVLLFHELGHLVAMYLSGYRDMRMFFIPFLGAAVQARASGVAGWKRGVVLLAGPVPGIVLGVVAWKLGLGAGRPLVAQAIAFLIVVNGFNLVPVVPLDGGRLVELIGFGRSSLAEQLAVLVSALALGGFALYTRTWVLLVIVYFLIRSLRPRAAVNALALAYLARVPAPSPRLEDAPEAELEALYGLLAPAAPTLRDPPRLLAQAMRNVHDRATLRRPGWAGSLALVVAYAAATALVLVFLLPVWQARAAAEPPPSALEVGGMALAVPPTFAVIPQGDAALLSRGGVRVFVAASRSGAASLEPGVRKVLGPPDEGSVERAPCRLGDRTGAGTSWEVGGTTFVTMCVVAVDGRAYVGATASGSTADVLDVQAADALLDGAQF